MPCQGCVWSIGDYGEDCRGGCCFGSRFTIGEQVEVALLNNNMGTRSVVLAYVVPFVVLSVMLVGATIAGFSEGVAVLAAMAGVVAYYVVLWSLRERLKNKIKFIIIKQTK